LFNAAEKLQLDIQNLCQPFDSISICLSKGLGAPAGSVLVGDLMFIAKARRWRKMLGGGMRQAGILAAAGIYALDHNVSRLKLDHQHAHILSKSLAQYGFHLKEPTQTNMIFLDISEGLLSELSDHLRKQGILISGNRWVLHKDIAAADLAVITEACEQFMVERN